MDLRLDRTFVRLQFLGFLSQYVILDLRLDDIKFCISVFVE